MDDLTQVNVGSSVAEGHVTSTRGTAQLLMVQADKAFRGSPISTCIFPVLSGATPSARAVLSCNERSWIRDLPAGLRLAKEDRNASQFAT